MAILGFRSHDLVQFCVADSRAYIPFFFRHGVLLKRILHMILTWFTLFIGFCVVGSVVELYFVYFCQDLFACQLICSPFGCVNAPQFRESSPNHLLQHHRSLDIWLSHRCVFLFLASSIHLCHQISPFTSWQKKQGEKLIIMEDNSSDRTVIGVKPSTGN